MDGNDNVFEPGLDPDYLSEEDSYFAPAPECDRDACDPGYDERNDPGPVPSIDPDFYRENLEDNEEDLPFEIDDPEDKKVFESPTECLLWAYDCTESAGELGTGLHWIYEGLEQWPDHPDLLAFTVIYHLKNYIAFKDDYNNPPDYKGEDPNAEKLLAMDRENLTIRAYVACLVYLIYWEKEDCEARCRQLVDEMQSKFRYDVCGNLAELLLEQKFGDGLTDSDIEGFRTMYKGLYEFQIMCGSPTDNKFSDYVTSVLPLIEMIVDEFQWPDKEAVAAKREYMKRHKEFMEKFLKDNTDLF